MTENTFLSEFEPRHNTYMHPSWLGKGVAGSSQCLFSLYAQANYKLPSKDSDFDPQRYKIQHQALMMDTVKQLKADAYTVYVEGTNSFWVNMNDGKAAISAQPDIVAIRGTEVLIIDCKTGKPKACDRAQVMLYMLLVPVVQLHGMSRIPEGRLVYRDYASMDIPATEITEDFKTQLRDLVRTLKADVPPSPVPSVFECQWCRLSDVCPYAVKNRHEGVFDLF